MIRHAYENAELLGKAALSRIQQNAYLWIAFLFGITFIINGFDVTDLGDFLSMSGDVFHLNLVKDRQFIYSSPLNVLIANALRLGNINGFLIIHVSEIFIMLGAIAFSVRKKFSDPKQQIIFLTLIALTPLFIIVCKWIGKTDAVIISCIFFSWAFTSRWRIASSIVLIAAHREIGSLAVIFLYVLEEKKDRSLMLALLLGNIFHLSYQYGLLDHAPQSRLEFMSTMAPIFLSSFSVIPTLFVMSMFSWYWVAIIRYDPTLKEAVIIIIAFCLSVVNDDFTRDFILTALPAVLFHAERIIKTKDAYWQKLWPLTPLHFQIAAMGHVAFANNPMLKSAIEAWKH